ncbi:hypothetical protein ACSFA7_14235 [Variovorax sp. LT1R20]|uniref:hypothetical protein n=1 Tax=Variovorax sp. LT1R20 TaxID=3443729 RepID=UPI003F451533
MTASLYLGMAELLATDPLLFGVVSDVFPDGTATVSLPGGGQMRVRNPLGLASAATVYLQGGAITGSAPAFDVIEVFI